jgi:hypothetical protein
VRAVIVLFVVAGVAVAGVAAADPPDNPRALPLTGDAVEVIAGHLAIRPLAGAEIDHGRMRITYRWGQASVVMTMSTTTLAGGADLRAEIVRAVADDDRRVAAAQVVPLAVAAPLSGFAVVPRTPARADELVLAAYVAGADGSVDRLAFYIDDDGAAELPAWVDVARAIAETASASSLAPTRMGRWVIDLPRAGRVRTDAGTRAAFRLSSLGCAVESGGPALAVLDAAAATDGVLLGQRTTWWTVHSYVWEASAQVDETRILCLGQDRQQLDYARFLAGTLVLAP